MANKSVDDLTAASAFDGTERFYVRQGANGRKGLLSQLSTWLQSTFALKGAAATSGLTMATARLLGRTTAATGAIEEISIGAGLTLAAGSLAVNGQGEVLIEEYLADGSTGSKTFSSIPGTYRGLRLVWVVRSSAAATADTMSVRFNGDTTASYDRQLMSGSNTALSASTAMGGTNAAIANVSGDSAPAGACASGEMKFPDYAGTTFHKTGSSSLNTYKIGTAAGDVLVRAFAIHWRNTAAISSMAVSLSTGNYMTGSKLQLYGVL